MIHRIHRWWNPPDEIEKTHRHVRLAICLAGFCLFVTFLGFFFWLRDNENQAERAAYQTALIDWRRCSDRAESGAQIVAVNTAAVAHAQETADAVAATARTFDEIVAVFEASAAGSQRLVVIRELVDRYSTEVAAPYQQGVDEYRAAVAAYKPQDPDACPPKPDPPD